MNIKKILTLLMALVMVCICFSSCSSSSVNEEEKEVNTTAVPTEKAKIKESDAIHFIQDSYTPEELGLDKTDKDYSFMVASDGVEIDGKKYVKVVANVIVRNDVTSKDGKETFSLETMGEYYISFDAEEVMMKNLDTNKFIQLENRYDSYLQNSASSTSAEESTSK